MVREDSAGFKIHTIMTEKDKQLIAQARCLNYTEWYEARKLAEQADTEEARRCIIGIEQELYHKEEYYAGML